MEGLRILVVDDERLIRWSIRERLEQDGFLVVEAESGRQALGLLREEIDLVLLDMKLPDIDGLVVLKEIRHRDRRPRVILMTAYGTPETLQEGLDHGAYTVVDKPFAVDGLVRLVREALAPEATPRNA